MVFFFSRKNLIICDTNRYPASEEVVVPWNARYSFPSQANKAVKITPRIPPKNGAAFAPGQGIFSFKKFKLILF
jgi:hypothetical protein